MTNEFAHNLAAKMLDCSPAELPTSLTTQLDGINKLTRRSGGEMVLPRHVVAVIVYQWASSSPFIDSIDCSNLECELRRLRAEVAALKAKLAKFGGAHSLSQLRRLRAQLDVNETPPEEPWQRKAAEWLRGRDYMFRGPAFAPFEACMEDLKAEAKEAE